MTEPTKTQLFPAEWKRHDACWLAWPHHEDWRAHLERARAEVAILAREIAAGGERVELLFNTEALRAEAAEALKGIPHRAHVVRYGDIWLRDTGPIFVFDDAGQLGASIFVFNGWGEKYIYDGDTSVGGEVANLAGVEARRHSFVLEGGAIEVDGEGTCITTRQCQLSRNRNGDAGEDQVDRWLAEALGAERVLWLDEGLANDHTDGHIDTLVRFVAPGVVVCMEPSGADDPNRDVLLKIRQMLGTMRDARGRKLEIMTMPSPGRVEESGELLPASYANFYIANEAVIVPTYGSRWDDAALAALEPLFAGRRVVGASARSIVTGGGAFHCITQQQPVPPTPRS